MLSADIMIVSIKVKHKGETHFVLVDEEDYPKVYQYSWSITKRRGVILDVRARVEKKKQKLHRVIMGCVAGDGRVVDHIDRNPLNNSKSNLRLVTKSENSRNKKTSGKSRFPGVCWHKAGGKWHAQIQKDRKHIHLGLFILEEMAAKAYRTAALELDPHIDYDVWKELD